jgi:hypothetical protein
MNRSNKVASVAVSAAVMAVHPRSGRPDVYENRRIGFRTSEVMATVNLTTLTIDSEYVRIESIASCAWGDVPKAASKTSSQKRAVSLKLAHTQC